VRLERHGRQSLEDVIELQIRDTAPILFLSLDEARELRDTLTRMIDPQTTYTPASAGQEREIEE